MSVESERLVIKAMRTAIACAFLTMAFIVASIVIAIARSRCTPCQLEKP